VTTINKKERTNHNNNKQQQQCQQQQLLNCPFALPKQSDPPLRQSEEFPKKFTKKIATTKFNSQITPQADNCKKE
jgi:hypothetical protein